MITKTTISEQSVSYAKNAGSVDWDNINNKHLDYNHWLPANNIDIFTDSRIPYGLSFYSVNPNILPSIGYPLTLTPYGTMLILKNGAYNIVLFVDVFGCPAFYNTSENQWNVIKTSHS